jgi:hypothetical protein
MDCGRELIRVGGNGDGGYLIPDDLDGIEYCFSPGVGPTSAFESDLADRGISSFLADYSVDFLPLPRPEFTFDKKYLGASDSSHTFTLAAWKTKYLGEYTGDLILQMDIEGSEYQVLLNVPDELLKQFRIIVIEFHFLHRLFDQFDFTIMSSCFEKLLANFHVAHLHPNNSGGAISRQGVTVPRLMEFTFMNKNRAALAKPVANPVHTLDRDCDPSRAPLLLPPCWYSDSNSK